MYLRVRLAEATPAGFEAEQWKTPASSGRTLRRMNSDTSCEGEKKETRKKTRVKICGP